MPTTSTPSALMTIAEFRDWAKIGRTRIYEELAKGTLKAIKMGSRTLILADSAHAWLAAQPLYKEA